MSGEELYRDHVAEIAEHALSLPVAQGGDAERIRYLSITQSVHTYLHGRDDDTDRGLQLMVAFVLAHTDTARLMDAHCHAFGTPGRMLLTEMAARHMAMDVLTEVDRRTLSDTERPRRPAAIISGG